MAKWTLETYKKLCQDTKDQVVGDYPDATEEHYYEFAIIALREEKGLKKFMKDVLGDSDYQGRLADDMAFPGNCRL